MEENKKDVIEEVVDVPADKEKVSDTVQIAPDVVATIAGLCASEIKGVAGMYTSFAGGIAERLGAKKNATKGIKVDIKGPNAVIDLFIIVEFGVRIPELAWEIQESVKENVETMTGLSVEKVNIHVDGVSFKKPEENKIPDDVDSDEEITVEEVELEDVETGESEEK